MLAFNIFKNEKWIYGSREKDFWILFFPPLFIILYFALFRTANKESWYRLLVDFMALVIIDNGHIFSTFWRTYFNPNELHRTRSYIYIPFVIFISCLFFSNFNYQRFWTFVVYAAMYHTIRQMYGYFKWYGKINNYYDKALDYFLYAFCYFPILIFHLDKPRITTGYFANDIFNFYNEQLFHWSWSLYYFTWAGFIAYLWWLFNTKRFPPFSQLFFLLITALMYNRSFIPSLTRIEMIEILALPHGVSYILSMVFIARKVKTESKQLKVQGFKYPLLLNIFGRLSLKTLTAVVLISTALFGLSDYLLDNFYLDIANPNQSFLSMTLSAIWITPLLSHYYFDAVIWRHNHQEFQFITDLTS